MVVRLISSSWAQKRLIPAFLTWCMSCSWKIFLSPIRASWWLLESFRPPEPKNVWFPLSRNGVRRVHESFYSPIRVSYWLWDSFWPYEPKNVWFLLSRHDVRRVHKNFLLSDSSELMAVRVISASWAQKRFIPTFYTWCTSSSENFYSLRFERAIGCKTHFGLMSPKMFDSYLLDTMYLELIKNFFSPIRPSWWLLESFRPPEPKNVWFLLSRHGVRRVHESFYSPIRVSYWLWDSFWPYEPKNVWFLLSRHDVRRVHKNFLLSDSSELMAVRVISASWAQKPLIPTFYTWCTSSSENFYSLRFERAIGCKTHFGLMSPKTFDSYFLDMMYLELIKNFFSPIRASWWLLESFRPPEPKNVWFLLSRHGVRRVHESFYSPIRVSYWLLYSFWPYEPKNIWFLLSRHDVRRVHKNFLLSDSRELMAVTVISASWAQKRLIPTFYTWCTSSSENFYSLRFERAIGCKTHFGLMSPKTFDSYFLDMMYLELIKNFFSPIRASWWLLESFWPPEPKNVWFLLSRHGVRRVHESFYSPIRVSYWLLYSFWPYEPKNIWFLLSRHDVRRVHKNFLLSDSRELMAVRVISASWAQKRLIPTFYTWCTSSSENFYSLRFERAIGCKTHFGLMSPKTFDSYFLDMMYLELIKNFFSPIRASWWLLESFWPREPKNVSFLLSRHGVRRVHESFYSPIRVSYWLWDSFWPYEPKNVSFLLSRHDVRRVHKNFLLSDSSELMAVRLISASWAKKRLIPTF